MTRKSSKVAVETVSVIEIADAVADTVAVTLSDLTTAEIVAELSKDHEDALDAMSGGIAGTATLTGTRRALDASDTVYNPSYSPATPIFVFDKSYSPATPHTIVPMGGTVEQVPVDPMAPYLNRTVKLSYLFDNGFEMDMNRLFKGSDASVEAAKRANDQPRVPVIIRDATTGQELTTVYPVAGARSVKVVSGNRPAATVRTVKAGATPEEIELQEWLAAYNAATKENDRRNKEWDAAYDAAEKENKRIDAEKDKAEKELAKKIAKALKANARHPDIKTDKYHFWTWLTAEEGATCPELNNLRNQLKGICNSNHGWRQVADDLERDYGMLLLVLGRKCKVSTKPGLATAMRLIYRDEKIPVGWIADSKCYSSTYVEPSEV